jgi:hypothetical protein
MATARTIFSGVGIGVFGVIACPGAKTNYAPFCGAIYAYRANMVACKKKYGA